MRAAIIAALVALSCCTPPRAVSPCGLRLHGASWLTAEDLQAAERETLARDGPLLDGDSCAALAMVDVTARAPGAWTATTDEGTVDVDGLANCEARTIEVAAPDGPWQFSALAHEITHHLTHCNGHVGWSERGISQALVEVYFTGVPDVR